MRLLIAENLADDVVLLSLQTGKVLRRFDLSVGKYVPTGFPYGVVANRDGTRAWCSLWNGSQVAELDLRSGKVVRQIALMPPKTATDASSHPTALLLSPDERRLYVTLSNRDAVAVISAGDGQVERYLDTRLPGQTYGGSYPNALAQSQDGSKLFVANASSDAVAVFDLKESAAGLKPGWAQGTATDAALKGRSTRDVEAEDPGEKGGGAEGIRAAYFIPTEWYPQRLPCTGTSF